MAERTKRTLLGLLIAPAVPGALFVILSVFLGNLNEGVWVFQLASSVAYAVALVIGAPLVIVLNRFNIFGLPAYIITGQVLSSIPSGYLVIYPILTNPGSEATLGTLPPSAYLQIAIIALLGLITTFTYWFIARPDRS